MARQSQNLTDVMLHGPILPMLLRLASPNVLAFFVQTLVGIAEVWYVGQLGTLALAGLALVYPLLMLMNMMSAGALGGAVASSVARSVGRGAIDRGEALIWHALVLGGAGAGCFTVVYFSFGDTILSLLGGEGEVLIQARAYAVILFLGCGLLWTVNILASVFRGVGEMKFPAALMLLGVCIQVPLSGALILGWGPFPQMGISGAALSAMVSATVTILILLARLLFGHPLVKLRAGALRLQRELFRDILKVGLLASVSPFISIFTVLCITSLVSRFGPAALAGYGIGARLEFMIVPLIFGIGAALTAMVGVNTGAGKRERALRIGWIGAATAGALAGGIGLLVAIFPELWVGLYTDDAAVFASGSAYLRIVGSLYLFQGVGLALFFASQGAGTVVWPVAAVLLRFIVAAGGGAIVVMAMDMGLTALFILVGAGTIIFGTVTALSILFGAWRRG